MGKWKTNDLEQIEVKIKIPKNTVAFIVNTMCLNDFNNITMTNAQYDSDDVERLKKGE